MMPEFEKGVIRTFTGKLINVFDPKPELICIEDIAHALSNLCRFGGHSSQFYSVAEHSLKVAAEVPKKELKLQALMHDAAEAYLLDVPTPIKVGITDYYVYEDRLQEMIARKFGYLYPFSEEVYDADKQLLNDEWELVVEGNHLSYITLTPLQAKSLFLTFFNTFKNYNK